MIALRLYLTREYREDTVLACNCKLAKMNSEIERMCSVYLIFF
jgi:hypothetical protein